MKTWMMGLALFAALPAQASWYQSYCGSADGATQIAEGHDENFIRVTARSEDGSGGDTAEAVLELPDGIVDVKKRITMRESSRGCARHEVTYKRVEIRNSDGSLFGSDIVGVTSDRKRVKAYLVCESRSDDDCVIED